MHRKPLVDLASVDLHSDEHVESPEELERDAVRDARLEGKWRYGWNAYYIIA